MQRLAAVRRSLSPLAASVASAASHAEQPALSSLLQLTTGSQSPPQSQQQQQPQQQTRRQYSDVGGGEPLIVPAARGGGAAPPPQQQQSQHAPALQQPQEVALQLPEANRGPWKRVTDKQTGDKYWWQPQTNVTTPVGAAKPDAWVAVVDKQGAKYFWNKDSGETTAVGEPLPGPEGRQLTTAGAGPAWQQQQQRQPGAASTLANSLAVGFGVGLVFAVIRLVF